MSAIPIQETESVLAELPQPKGPGARLKAARKSRNIDLDKVAAQLHLRRDMLIALEEDDYDHLPARVFIVGYMRNYARYIGLPAEAIIQSLDQFLPPEDRDKPGLPKVGSDAGEVFKPSAKARKSPFSLISLVLLAAAVGAFFIWKEGYLDNAATPTSALIGDVKLEITGDTSKPLIQLPVEESTIELAVPEAVEPQVVAPQVVVQVKSPLEVAVTEPVVAEPETVELGQVPQEVIAEKSDETSIPASEPVAAEAPLEVVAPVTVENSRPLAADGSGIVLKLSGKSWIEVTDASGDFRLNNLYQAGTEKTFGGKPPYKVLIGNAAEASLMVNGVAFDLENHSKANVARFTLEPSTL